MQIDFYSSPVTLGVYRQVVERGLIFVCGGKRTTRDSCMMRWTQDKHPLSETTKIHVYSKTTRTSPAF